MKCAIVDYGMGNTGSIENMIRRAGGDSVILTQPEKNQDFDKIILPGVGHFDNAVNKLNHLGFSEFLNRLVLEKGCYLLGVCLGMQLLAFSSEEGTQKGFGFINGHVKRFLHQPEQKLKIPHMGWNLVKTDPSDSLVPGDKENRFYFVHSYYMDCIPGQIRGTTHYGVDFTSYVAHENVFGVQFHPEKSHRFGMELIRNFLKL